VELLSLPFWPFCLETEERTTTTTETDRGRKEGRNPSCWKATVLVYEDKEGRDEEGRGEKR
jgi:hypothetical protein